MVDLTTIPTDELLNDLAESRMDMFFHMKLGFSDNNPRIKVNHKVIEVIKPELERRGVSVPPCSFPNVP